MKVSTGKLLLALAASATIIGCATIGPPQPPSLELPRPPSDLRATRKGGKVTLTWTIPSVTTDRQTARSLGPTRICRGVEPVLNSCGSPAAELALDVTTVKKPPGHKITNAYTDLLPPQWTSNDASAFATYAIEVLNSSGHSAGLSNQVRVPLLQAPPAPADFRASLSNQGIQLTWTGIVPRSTSSQPLKYLYRVYRRPEDSEQQVLVGQLQAGTESPSSLADQSFEWEKTYYYRAAVLTVIAQPGKPEIQFDGDDTPEIKVFAHDVFPPAVPSGLQAVFSGPGQQPFIDLIWAPVADIDLAGYNIYRHEAGTEAEKVNAELLKTPAYRDQSVASGRTYVYSVSAVDVRANESARSEEASERVP